MVNQQSTQQYDIGMVGLGVMGRNLLLNMADHGYSVAGYDKDITKVNALHKEAGERKIRGASDINEFIGMLRQPRMIMILVPAGPPVDAVIQSLLPFLQPGDMLIDGGNSYFKDTDVRAHNLKELGIHFLGVGISGGEKGARNGPSIMPGGPKEAYEHVRPIFEAVAAKVEGMPCVSWLGFGSAGHYVKMVHNGIEYGIMQLIAETYDLMKRGLKMSDDEISKIYASWDKGKLNGYLLEITSKIFNQKDERSEHHLIDVILNVAKQNGTGLWTSQNSMALQIPTPTIDVAVSMRDMSVFENQRTIASKLYQRAVKPLSVDKKSFLDSLQNALYASIIIAYAQGFALLVAASAKYDYQIDSESVALIWRGGCIIRSTFLNDISAAFRTQDDLENILLDSEISQKLMGNQEGLRQVVSNAVESGISIPALMASLSYFDAYRSQWLPANLIQAQRDYFGAHTYERTDCKGTFHTQWDE